MKAQKKKKNFSQRNKHIIGSNNPEVNPTNHQHKQMNLSQTELVGIITQQAIKAVGAAGGGRADGAILSIKTSLGFW